MVVLDVAEAAAATNDVDLAEQAGRLAIPHIRVFCVLDTMDNLRKGGRVGAAKALLGSILSVKPIIEISDGVVRTESQPRTRARSLEYLADIVKRSGRPRRLGVAHAAAPDVDRFVGMLAGSFPVDDILVNYLGPVIGAHGGPGCMGVALL
jgi:DegV family protein with EDD domain